MNIKVFYLSGSDKVDGLVHPQELPDDYTSFGTLFFVCNEPTLPRILEILADIKGKDTPIIALLVDDNRYRSEIPDIGAIEFIAEASELSYVGTSPDIKLNDKLWHLRYVDPELVEIACHCDVCFYGYEPTMPRAPP